MSATLIRLAAKDRELFATLLKESFDEFSREDVPAEVIEHAPEAVELPIITIEEIYETLDSPKSKSYWALVDGERVGGTVVTLDEGGTRGEIELLFVISGKKGCGAGAEIVQAIEEVHAKVATWELFTPYIEVRNIHFYVNKCGYKIVEFHNPRHPMPPQQGGHKDDGELFFRFEKKMSDIPRR